MSQLVELSDATFDKLQQVAKRNGVTPSEWLETTISREPADFDPAKFRSVAEAIAPYISSVDSRINRPDPKYRSKFGDIVDEKMAKQGFERPEWQR